MSNEHEHEHEQNPDGTESSANPYSAPLPAQQYLAVPYPTDGRYVRQVKPLCICMIIHGALEMLAALYCVASAFMSSMFVNPPGGPQIPAAQQQFIENIAFFSLAIAGAVVGISGIMRVTAGWSGLYFRNRRLGVISHFFGLLNILTCYCLPTSIGLCVWGSMVYFKPEVKNAFLLGEEGYDAADIESGVARQHHGE